MSITVNKKAFHDYFVEDKYEAGIVLEGWEVKAIRAGRMNIKESYVIIKGGELFLIGMHISPLTTASTHNKHDPTRTRKLLLHAHEISKLIGKVERAGYALVPARPAFPARPDQARDRPGQGQEAARQAGRRTGEGYQARSPARDEGAPTITGIAMTGRLLSSKTPRTTWCMMLAVGNNRVRP